MSRITTWLLPLVVAFAAFAGPGAGDASAGEADRISLGEVSVETPSPGVDRATLKSAGEGEIKSLDASRLPASKRILVSLAVVRASDGPISCEVTAMLRDRKTGSMLAVLGGRARAEGTGGVELRRAVLRAAVRTAVRQIPDALASD